MIDLTQLTEEELHSLYKDAADEMRRRDTIATIEEQAAAVNVDYLNAIGRASGEEWVQPTGAHDAHPLGWIVTHDDKMWESLIPANVWEPGVSGWREVTVDDAPPEWVRPTGAHDAYQYGDRVMFEDQIFESTLDGNVWSPTEHPTGWQLVDTSDPEPA